MAAITANNIVVSIEFSNGFQDGIPVYTSYGEQNINCYVRSYERQSKLASIDLAAIGDTEEKAFFTRASGTVQLEIYVDNTIGIAFQTYLYHYIKVSAAIPYSGGFSTWIDEGVVSEVSLSQDLDGILTERVTVTLGTYGVDGYGGIF